MEPLACELDRYHLLDLQDPNSNLECPLKKIQTLNSNTSWISLFSRVCVSI
jgi:hypothetical protein